MGEEQHMEGHLCSDGDNIPIIGQNALQTSSNLDGLVIDIILLLHARRER